MTGSWDALCAQLWGHLSHLTGSRLLFLPFPLASELPEDKAWDTGSQGSEDCRRDTSPGHSKRLQDPALCLYCGLNSESVLLRLPGILFIHYFT